MSSRAEDLWGEYAPGAPRRLLAAGLDAFADVGYTATTTRDIARRAGMSPAAMYIHYASKGELLFHISRVGHIAALAALTAAQQAGSNPADRIPRMVAAAVTWHAEHHRLAYVVQFELDAVPAEHRAEIAALRRAFEGALENDLRQGAEAGDLAVDDIECTSLAMLSLCIDVARWYRHVRRPAPAELGARYARIARRMLGIADAA